MSVINTNYLSLVAQNNLNKSQSALGSAIERLSSGLRINSAKDDAAGQAIANRMSSQIAGLNQASRNANDGISAAQTTEGALNQVNDNLQRIRVLTVQATNGTNSTDDLTSIQNEIGQRLGEIDRISRETEFNGVKVLASDQTLKIQVGANDGQTIDINLSLINSKALGLEGFNVNGQGEVANAAASADDLTLSGFTAAAKANANGSVTYTKDTVTDNKAMTAANLMGKLDDNATVALSSTAKTGYYSTIVAADIQFNNIPSLQYVAADNNFKFDLNGVDAASAASNIVPDAGEGARAATVKIGTTTTDVLIKEDGSITNTNNEALFIDSSGNLTATTSGTNATYANATVDNLTALMFDGANSSIKAADNGTNLNLASTNAITAEITLTDSGTKFTGTGDSTTGIDVTDAVVSKAAVTNMLAADGGVVTLASGIPVTNDAGTSDSIAQFSVLAGGAVQSTNLVGGISASEDLYIDANGGFTGQGSTTTTTTYYAQESGMVTDDTGAQVYVDQNGALTMSDVTEGARTQDPLDVLDSAISSVDALRSDLGAIQNRFESSIQNLTTTSTNLSAARSRIEDADYAVEVANMTRAQILQQAGTSVLAQANQIPQGVLSLLR
jgi:flagellin